MPISYDSSTNVISVVGGSEVSPYSFEDIYQADQNNGWGVVEKHENQYIMKAKLRLGDGTTETWFKDESKQILFKMSVSNSTHVIRINNKAHLQFGRVSNFELKRTINGCNLIFDCGAGFVYIWNLGDLNVYATTFQSITSSKTLPYIYGLNGNFWNSRTATLIYTRPTANIYNSVCYTYYQQPLGDATIEYLFVNQLSCWGSASQRKSFRFTKLIVQNTNLHIAAYGDTYLIDLDAPEGFTVNQPTECHGFIQWSFDLKVTDKEGNPIVSADVKLYNKNNDLVFEVPTNENGDIPTQIVTEREIFEDHIETHNPFRLVIERSGYKPYEMVLEIKKTTALKIALGADGVSVIDVYNLLQEHRDTVEPKIDTSISSRASQESVNAIPTNPLLDNDPRLDNLDAKVSSRLASDDSRLDNLDVPVSSRSSHTPADVWNYSTRELTNPDNYKADVSDLAKESTVQSIKSQTDKIKFNAENDVIATLDGEKVSLTDETESQIDNTEAAVNQIKSKTDNLPDDPASTTDITDAKDAIINEVTTNRNLINQLLDIEEGNWEIKNNQMIFYRRDGTELMRFNLYDKNNQPTETNVYKREKV